MNAIHLTPVICHVNRAGVISTGTDKTPATGTSYALRLKEDGSLAAMRFVRGAELPPASRKDGRLVAFVHNVQGAQNGTWVMAACATDVALNAVGPPLAAAVIEPGMLLAIGDRSWFISSLWDPMPVEAPPGLRDKPCPVCGGALGLAAVVQCSCGRWAHLENAAALDDTEALNCFTAAGTCGGCGRPATLEPHIVPEVPERLAPQQADDESDER